MAPLSGKQRKAQLKLKRAVKRGDVPPPPVQSQKRKKRAPGARNPPDKPSRNARDLQSEFIKLDKAFLDDTKALAGSIVLRRPILADVAVLRHGWISPSPPGSQLPQVALPKRPKWRYQMSKEELDANEQAHFRTWLAQQDAIIEQWQRALNCPPSADPTALAGDHVDDSETRLMPYPPTHFERNIEVWRQFWRVTEISQILLVLLDSRCPPLHLPSSLSAFLNIPTPSPSIDSSPRSKQTKSKAPHIILVLTKADISGPARTASWTSFLNTSYPGVPVVPVEAYAPKSLIVEQGPTRYEPHLPGTFRERLVDTLRALHEQLLQPPQWVTAPRPGESEEERLLRIDQWRPRVKRVIDWNDVLAAKGNRVGKAVGGVAVPRGQDIERETEGTEMDEEDDVKISDSEEEQTGDASEWKEPEFLTIGVIGQPNVGKSSLLNAIFGKTRVRASRTPGKTKHFQTLFWTSDVRLIDCPGLVMPSFVPMDIQVLSGVLPISRISAVPFCIHQLARLLPLEQILELTHPSSSVSTASTTVASARDRDPISQSGTSNAKSKPAPTNAAFGEDKRTWRPGQRPLEQTKVQSKAPRWTASDIMTAYADKKGWVTAKAGRPDIHRAGNAILRLVAEGKIPWAFWPPGSSVSTDDGIWAKDGVQQHARDDLETDEEEEENEMGELSSEAEDINAASGESDDEDEDEEKAMLNSWFSSRSSRHRKTPSSPPPAPEDAQTGASDASSISQSTVGPSQTPANANLTSTSDIPLDEAYAHIDDPSVYAPTPSLIHSPEKDAGTLKTSDALASLEATSYHRDSTRITTRVSAPERPEKNLFTPQDAIIAQVFGKSVHPATDPAHGTPPPPSNAPQPSMSLMTSDSVPTPASVQPPRARPGPTLPIYDPFSGVKLGEHSPMSPSTATPGEPSTPTPLPTADDRRLWSSLERILELQAEIAAMHADMEGVGKSSVGNPHTAGGMTSGESGNAGSRKRMRMRRGQTMPVGDEEPEEHEPESGVTGVTVSDISTDHSDGEDDDDDDDDEDGVHGYGKRRRDEEFARLAEQFAQRKAAIGGIMNKLDALSTALKTFHTLPPPLFDLTLSPSRTNTMPSAPSNVSVASSPPPLHVYYDQPVSPLSSISPSQASHSVTPPTVSVSPPPVPPISTLASPVSSGDRSTPRGLAPLVTPTLPQVVLPTIIHGAPHVESPADMEHAQSMFRRV
ncbi:hypothetical protein JVT61DRAFT_5280 [Boletus reticuloceps]|uniref:Guanine nucleotide-binding protein-like 1 n=1 Tax=Boletus reticuloceps TaxID=495285 RepID=A0A8I3AD21_9AGAM|nr:hypothetical protein JVT61DRAFT_5280 [Boletus reticuloceps]